MAAIQQCHACRLLGCSHEPRSHAVVVGAHWSVGLAVLAWPSPDARPHSHCVHAGMQRFKIAEVIQAKPILVAAVDILPEQDQADTDDEVH